MTRQRATTREHSAEEFISLDGAFLFIRALEGLV